jgi:predicted metal-binding protein
VKEKRIEDLPAHERLSQLAYQLGASRAGMMRTDEVVIEDRLAALCREPRCQSYGLSAGCPPHVTGPAGFREWLKDFKHALVFLIEVPSEILLSNERTEVFMLLHEISAQLEEAAIQMGHPRARGFAGGSCKRIFCSAHDECLVLSGGECRNPDRARPSLSGFGINVNRLAQAAGWQLHRVAHADKMATASICGMVLID